MYFRTYSSYAEQQDSPWVGGMGRNGCREEGGRSGTGGRGTDSSELRNVIGKSVNFFILNFS